MPLLVLGLVLVAAALALGAVVVLLPRRVAAAPAPAPGSEPRVRRTAADLADDVLRRRGLRDRLEDALELAGIGWQPASFVLAVVGAAVAAVLLGIAVAVLRPGPAVGVLPVLLVIAVLIGARLVVSVKTTKRRAEFADQLDDTLQLVASGLRAGHSLVRALDAVAREAESPTAEEFARVVNENRLGRDVSDALADVATRMRSDDLAWVAQAVAIHREVGGNLSEVLDHVGETIRERGQVARQVATLSAEGRLSANILIGLPIVIALILSFVSPGYLTVLFTTPLGLALVGVSLLLFAVGVVWLRRTVRVDF